MRLIGVLDNEKQAHRFSAFLLKERIKNSCEAFQDPGTGQVRYRIWVEDEEALEPALKWMDAFQKNPEESQFVAGTPPLSVAFPPKEEKSGGAPPRSVKRRGFALTLTNLLLLACVALFLWNDTEEMEIVSSKGALALQIALTPVQQALIFDFPYAFQALEKCLEEYPVKSLKDLGELPPEAQQAYAKAEGIPYWKGVFDLMLDGKRKGWQAVAKAPLFEKIRQGQAWRLFTPCLLHRDFLHILFNMGWLWILGKQIEERLKKTKMLLLVLLIGILSNIAQYFMSGPYFLGFSGIVVGMVGFIWMRQKKAPWEGYPLQKGVIAFMVIFVGAMFALELLSFTLRFFSLANMSANIANTAHIAGGLVGLGLGRMHFFGRRTA